MYINNKKRKLDSRDLDTVANAEYFTCIYYQSQGKSLRSEFNTYKRAYSYALTLSKCNIVSADNYESNWISKGYDKRKFMFYAVKGTSQCHIGGLK